MSVKAKLVGAAGYGGIGLVELLTFHPEAEIVSLTDKVDFGKPLSAFYPHLRGICDLEVQEAGKETESAKPDVVFFATPNGVGMHLAKSYLDRGVKVIDYSGDFRFLEVGLFEEYYGLCHASPELAKQAVYGLPELYREQLRSATLVGNPGCLATSAILAVTPALKAGLIDHRTLIIDAKTGVSGAGKNPNPSFHFPHRNENMNAYRVVSHQHVPEIEDQLSRVAGEPVQVGFTPHVVPQTRGILATAYATLRDPVSADTARAAYQEHYAGEPFVRVMPTGDCPGTIAVRGSNLCDLTVNVDERNGRLIVCACLDNLMKGQSGSALQNMNLICGLDETLGLARAPFYP
ncbi:MAG: N-acetyl-gamma-glutamyl-phosphate reductase [Armatimonadetes bacterium CG_4_10_14_3_um_filter_66_18]|nr:N-acetyl-gamma-glutamyl-phosphate reductase [Armatimonadota bacterium]OIO93301.1 MAG: N-acetyl-gamma-glutamyl-phosphate reductase [Armatimonadetes bacterium CG2_30_66_41]PIU95885.1 MAG: N-acetyl-gamma-glutamyl-phosphate reductase [Armatimonadetes bacterium CG06_land_8_20_14_3_00_66_21]PIX47891.1 MAG: N-acetyl-gamma-glutamyl-phosphate reductase [Armatimonadetes bacterium CG_4_8_14_3_um_filter_66_20]PIY51021.1 MAG: N-acetyl-gamma-glutamyl-phosphate reductase [Armatimonadetes bacterium CG_4_10_